MKSASVKIFVIRLAIAVGMFLIVPVIGKLFPCLEGLLATMPSASALIFYFSYEQFKAEGTSQAVLFAVSLIPSAVFYLGMYTAILFNYSLTVASLFGLFCWGAYGPLQQFGISKLISVMRHETT